MYIQYVPVIDYQMDGDRRNIMIIKINQYKFSRSYISCARYKSYCGESRNGYFFPADPGVGMASKQASIYSRNTDKANVYVWS